MSKAISWLKELRAPFLTATIVPIVLGSIMGWHQTGEFNWPWFWLALLGGVFMHLGTNIANDYYDHTSKDDWVNKTPTPFSGGSRMIQEGLIPAWQVLAAALLFFILGSAIGLYLNYRLAGNIILYLGIAGVLLGFFYTASPIRIGYRGFGIGELAVAIGFGPLMVLGAYYVQTQTLSWQVLFASIPVGILIGLVLYINEFPDYEADKTVGKITLPIMLGKKAASRLYPVLVGLNYLLVFTGIILEVFPLWVLLILLTLPVALKAVRTTLVHFDKVKELLPANASTILLHFSFGLLLSIGFIVDKLVGG
ncbi:1,4-dihydroxy-2-naphthoate octaprenyltransferase [Planctomycetota bacterium]